MFRCVSRSSCVLTGVITCSDMPPTTRACISWRVPRGQVELWDRGALPRFPFKIKQSCALLIHVRSSDESEKRKGG